MRPAILLFGMLLPSLPAIAGEAGFFEILVRDLKQAEAFYAQALGWEFQEAGKDFALVTNAGMKGGLLATREKVRRGDSVKLFFRSSELRSDLVKIQSAGGRVTIEPVNTGGESWIAEFKDPDGNWLGLICDAGESCAGKPEDAHLARTK